MAGSIDGSNVRSAFLAFTGVATERQTYRNLCYLFVTSILGGIYFVGLFFGFFVGIVLSVVLIGIPIIVALVAGARGAAQLERQLTNRLLGTDIQSPAASIVPAESGVKAALYELLASETTWKGVGFLAVKAIISVLLPVFVLVVGFTSLALLLAPLSGDVVLWERWTIDTLAESLLAVPLGVVLALCALHALNGLSRVTGTIAESLLE